MNGKTDGEDDAEVGRPAITFFIYAVPRPHAAHNSTFMKGAAMRRALRLLVFCVLTTSVYAGTTLPTAPQPVTIIRQNEMVHILTAAVDVNFNGLKDIEDRPATWQIVDVSTLTTQRTLELPWAQVNTMRPWLSANADLMFIAIGDSVNSYVASTQVFGRSFVIPGGQDIYGVYFDEQDQALRVSVRSSFTDPGQVISISPLSNNILPVGVNPQQIVGYNSTTKGRGFAVINEGGFGQSNGSVMLVTGAVKTLPLGDTPNHILVSGDSAYVTVNGSHYVVVVDLNTELAVDTILVGTSGSEGPREAAILDGRLFVSTFAGDVRILDIATGARVGFINHGIRPEGLAIVGSTLWVTRTMNANYVADSGVVVYELNAATDVPWDVFGASSPQTSPLTVAPSVSSTSVTVEHVAGTGSGICMDAAGRLVNLPLLESNEISSTYSVTSLPVGSYTIRHGSRIGRFVVIR